MTVAQLIAILKRHDGNRIVVLSADEEGNGFKPLGAIDAMVYNDEDDAVGYSEITPQLSEAGYGFDDLIEGEPAVILWP